eukprot:scpid92381/ scgid18464/ 
MSTEAFLLAFRWFIARRGAPALIMCNNAPQFILAHSVINEAYRKAVNSDETSQFCASLSTEWKFIVPYSPWMGGFYERMVGITKRCLRKILGALKLCLSQLQTVLSEVEAVVNSRPLT